MNKRIFNILAFGLILLSMSQAYAQGVRSPYTVLGIGELPIRSTVNNQGMGMTGVANPTYNFVNMGNPALLTYNSIFSFDMAGYWESRGLAKNELTENHSTGNFHHIAMALPLKRNRWTMGIGVNPLSTINHQIIGIRDVPGTNTQFINDLRYSGGMNEAYVAQGVRLGKYLNLGAKASYIFGGRNELNETFLLSDEVALADITTRYLQRQSYSDVSLSTGMAVVVPLKNRKQVTFGATYRLESRINGKDFSKLEQYRAADLFVITSDTILNDVPGSLLLPGELILGLSFERSDNYAVMAEFKTSDWSRFENTLQASSEMGRRTSFSLGGQYTPDYTSINNYLALMTYRFGVSYENTPFVVNGQQINEVALNFGLTAPLRYNSLNVGIQAGNRGSLSNNLIRENFFRISLGVSIGDEGWFYRQRFN